ncbi:hypothetical protein BLNAU_22415 [Blattamonas nauphoetae]|uniref:Uncharacterized protein n=1 Tax=Blattamonas nauphoetae TaxID=2049346 RepID=A0ABQ9WTP3_9EUKA|nr:hypothetical protein BLNAU_22415 [Blattamonas nauphoetae]
MDLVYKGSPSHGFSSNYVYQPHQTCTDALSHTFHTCLMLTAGLIADLHFNYNKCKTCSSKKHTHKCPRLPARALCLACRGSTSNTLLSISITNPYKSGHLPDTILALIWQGF